MDAERSSDDALRRRVEELQRRRAVRRADGAEPVAAAIPPSSGPARRARRGRPHVARRSRVGAAGIGFASMFGLVAFMGLAGREVEGGQVTLETATPTTVQPPAATPIVVVIHRVEPQPADPAAVAGTAATALPDPASPGAAQAGTTPAAVGPSLSPGTAPSPDTAPAQDAGPPASAPPIQLTAPPVVAPAPAPVATTPPTTPTSGSR